MFGILRLNSHCRVSPADRTSAGVELLGGFVYVFGHRQRRTASLVEGVGVMEAPSANRPHNQGEF